MKKIISICVVMQMASLTFAQEIEVPQHYVMKTGEDYARYEEDMLRCFNWLMSAPVDEQLEKRMDAGAFISKWVSGAPSVSIEIREEIVTFADVNVDLPLIFMGGWAKYELESKDTSRVNCNLKGIDHVIEFYTRNKAKLQKDKSVEKYIKMKENGTIKAFVQKNL